MCNLPDVASTISVSRQNELFDRFVASGVELMPVDTFTSNWGALDVSRLLRMRRQLAREIIGRRIDTVILLMLHVWAPLVMPRLDAMGKRYAIIVHDAVPHSGDPTSRVNSWIMRELRNADVVFTLSKAVRQKAAVGGKLQALFHPDLCYGEPLHPLFPTAGDPFRLAFFGHILPYMALPMLVEAVELMRNEGLRMELGVFGEGDISAVADRLRALSAEVVQLLDSRGGRSWHPRALLRRGAVARARQPIGCHSCGTRLGIASHRHADRRVCRTGARRDTGILADRADASSLAQAIKRLALNPALYRQLCDNIVATRETRSMRRFVSELVARATCPKEPSC